MRILVAKEKHGEQYLAADDAAQLAWASLRLLRERWEEGYWYEEPDEELPKILSEKEIEALPTEALKAVARRENAINERNRGYNENARKWWDSTEAVLALPEAEAVALNHSMFTGRLGPEGPVETVPLAWYLLQFRKDHEYEYVALADVEEP